MDEPKRVLVEDCLAANLPERLRSTFDDDAHVTVTVEAAPSAAKDRSITEIIESVQHLRRGGDDAVQRVREAREEGGRGVALHERTKVVKLVVRWEDEDGRRAGAINGPA